MSINLIFDVCMGEFEPKMKEKKIIIIIGIAYAILFKSMIRIRD